MTKSLCKIPYAQAFMNPDGSYRNCCSTTPQILGRETDFIKWWKGREMEHLRDSLQGEKLPTQCSKCQNEKEADQDSMLDVGWRDVKSIGELPSRFQIGFSNICNIGCWSCDENFSSVIQEEKRAMGILPVDHIDPRKSFGENWPSFKDHILKSYEEHDSILINVFGGEPTISKEFVEFLQTLVDLGLNERTRIEIFSNCNDPRDGFRTLLIDHKWEHISILASIDAIGHANDWIRYGSNWESVERNFHEFRKVADYIEIISVLSPLNASIFPELKRYCDDKNIKHTTQLANYPWFLDVLKWDGPIEFLGKEKDYDSVGYKDLWNKFSSNKTDGCQKHLIDYIKTFKNRKTHQIFDDLIASYN